MLYHIPSAEQETAVPTAQEQILGYVIAGCMCIGGGLGLAFGRLFAGANDILAQMRV
jgi:hypothetical protein